MHHHADISHIPCCSSQDPYVTIELSGQRFQTKSVTDGGKNPVGATALQSEACLPVPASGCPY